MISFFVFSFSDNHSLQCYSDSVCNRSDVVSLFCTCTHFHDVIMKSREPVLVYILWFYGFFRYHAKCR